MRNEDELDPMVYTGVVWGLYMIIILLHWVCCTDLTRAVTSINALKKKNIGDRRGKRVGKPEKIKRINRAQANQNINEDGG